MDTYNTKNNLLMKKIHLDHVLIENIKVWSIIRNTEEEKFWVKNMNLWFEELNKHSELKNLYNAFIRWDLLDIKNNLNRINYFNNGETIESVQMKNKEIKNTIAILQGICIIRDTLLKNCDIWIANDDVESYLLWKKMYRNLASANKKHSLLPNYIPLLNRICSQLKTKWDLAEGFFIDNNPKINDMYAKICEDTEDCVFKLTGKNWSADSEFSEVYYDNSNQKTADPALLQETRQYMKEYIELYNPGLNFSENFEVFYGKKLVANREAFKRIYNHEDIQTKIRRWDERAAEFYVKGEKLSLNVINLGREGFICSEKGLRAFNLRRSQQKEAI